MASEHIARLELYGVVDVTDPSAYERLADDLDAAMQEGAIDAADVLAERIAQDTPDWVARGWRQPDSRTITPLPDGARVTLRNDDEFAYYYWSGTKKHPIVARFAQALAFFWPNAPAIAGQPAGADGKHLFRSVMHPGTKKHPYVEESGAAALPAMRQSYEDAVRRAWEGRR